MTSTPPPGANTTDRRFTVGMIFGLMLFYIAVFSAVDLLGFRFPMPVLIGFFMMVAVPFGLFSAGSIYFVYLLRLKFGAAPPKPHALTLVSAFIGTTVIVTAAFVLVYPEWRQAQLDSWPKLIEDAADPGLPRKDVQRLGQDIAAVMNRVFVYYEEGDIEAIEADPQLIQAFQSVFTTTTDGKLDADEFARLRAAIPYADSASAATETSSATTATAP